MNRLLIVTFFLLVTSCMSGQFQSSILHLNANNRLVYHSDEDGNRILDFSHAGYKKGEVDLPVLPNVLKVSLVKSDNTAHVQEGNAPIVVSPEWLDIALDENQYVLERSSDYGKTFATLIKLKE